MTICRVLRSLRLIRTINKLFKIGDSDVSSVNRQILTIILTIITLIFITSGILLTFEAPKRLTLIEENKNFRNSYLKFILTIFLAECQQYNEATFHEMIYFVVVTLATVGYGDVVPYSLMGK